MNHETDQVAALLRAFHEGNEPLPLKASFSERERQQTHGRNIERGKMRAWARLKAHELGYPWPLPESAPPAIPPQAATDEDAR